MTFEEFEKATPTKLREEAKLCFDSGQQNPSWGGAPTPLLQAQFYLAEIDRRQVGIDRQEGAWIAKRDFWMEFIVISLIAVEIGIAVIAFYEGSKQTTVLESLQKSASATANTLVRLQATTERMSQTIQAEHDLTYRVSLDIVWDGNMLTLTNKGRANVALYGWKIGALPRSMERPPRILMAGNWCQLGVGDVYGEIRKLMGSQRSHVSLPFELYVLGNDGTHYVLKGAFVGRRNKDGNAMLENSIRTFSKAVRVCYGRLQPSGWHSSGF